MSRSDGQPSRRRVLMGALALGAVAGTPGLAEAATPSARETAARAARYVNPLVRNRADPHIFKHTDGYYYFTATAPEYDRIILRRSRTLRGLATASESVIWKKHTSGDMGAHIWAPEIHFIDGKWYVYFASAPAGDVWKIRMWVLENASANPFAGTWTEKGRIATPIDSFSLDASTFVHRGTRYLTWAQSNPDVGNNSSIYIAKMANPWTITGPQVEISRPTYDWETRGYKVNEGPSVLEKNGRLFLTYSASATDANYCMGLLTASADSDPLVAASWKKSPQPVFTSNDTTKQYGPGHNSFTVAEDGRTDVLVYHARQYKDITGDPLNDPNRHTRIQTLGWKADGTPDFGVPVADGPAPDTTAATRYTMTAFTNSSESNMYVYESPDALTYTLLKGPAFTPPAELIRDPSIIKHTDGYYYIVYTTNWTGNTIGFARSRDRANWTFVRNHTLPLAGVERTWAPEFFVDAGGSVNIIVSLDTTATPDYIFRPHLLTATSASLSSWTTPKPLTGLDKANYIDTFVVRHGGQYHAFTKQETTKYIEYATATSLGGPYTLRGTGDWAGWGSWREGPALVPLAGGGWRIYFDGYAEKKYYYSDSLDGFRTWTPIRQLPGLSGFARHFTVLKESV
ncbi:family 43 glycosylhydrolase [Streptomyces sp. Rer75]|uniref:family 43 glycosylhydrolase n=1 Tax=Streptomyces sp. Rer75 TaxID=2750011 RepID=UPI0015D00800|nr:family 43 glycosylhydrolase [Streptomyces sp. Rer75]QLH26445.1 family 43 glycosylhydrolase [Streptomyces sp. Rer75]